MARHHAVLIESSEPLLTIQDLYRQDGDEVYVFPSSTIGIAETRLLVDEASRTPLQGTNRLIIVEVSTLTVEAQNALLKLLEEPPRTTRFLFVLRQSLTLLPTLLSRFLVERSSMAVSAEALSAFGASALPERLRVITERLDKKDDAWIEEIRSGLRTYLLGGQERALTPAQLHSLGFIVTKLGTRGASNKMLLEELAFTLPVEQK